MKSKDWRLNDEPMSCSSLTRVLTNAC